MHRWPEMVYAWCMSRTNVDIDDEACAEVMRRYELTSKRDAVNLALRTLAAETLDLDAARALRGSGWEGELDQLRSART
jgi:Arc/MetJ family transcription regulator